MTDDMRRRAVLGWVQAHRITRYTDGAVVSHTEATEELLTLLTACDAAAPGRTPGLDDRRYVYRNGRWFDADAVTDDGT